MTAIRPGDRIHVLNANNEPMTKLIARREIEIEYVVRSVDTERGWVTTYDGALHSIKGVRRIGPPRDIELETSPHVEQVLEHRAVAALAAGQVLGRVVVDQIKVSADKGVTR